MTICSTAGARSPCKKLAKSRPISATALPELPIGARPSDVRSGVEEKLAPVRPLAVRPLSARPVRARQRRFTAPAAVGIVVTPLGQDEEQLAAVRSISARPLRASSMDQPRVSRRCLSARRDRFTPQEQAAFGRVGSGLFLAKAARRRLGSVERSPSKCESGDSDNDADCAFLPPCSKSVTSTQSAAVAPPLSVESPVRKMLAQLLPVENRQFKPTQRRRPVLHRHNAVPDFDTHDEFGSMGKCQLLERFRAQILERFRSVHDAFNQFDRKVSRDRALSLKEFCLAGRQLGISENELSAVFKALDTDQSGHVTMTEFLQGVVEDISPELLLWELRCRLDSYGIRANRLDRAFDLIRQHALNANKSRKRWDAMLEEDMKAEKLHFADIKHSKLLDRTDWMKLGTMLGLTSVESERLFDIIDEDCSGSLDIQEVFKAFQRVAPDVTIERFTTKVLIQYGTFQDAFKACSSSGAFGRKEFLAMAAVLDVNSRNSEQLWKAWEEQRNALGDLSASEEAFVAQMNAWAPDTVLDSLREQMLERFGGLVQGRNALQDAGLTPKVALTISSLGDALQAAGFCHCDAAALLNSVARCNCRTGLEEEQNVTLEDLVSMLQNGKGKVSQSVLRSVGHDIGACFQQLHHLKASIRMGGCSPEASPLSAVEKQSCVVRDSQIVHRSQSKHHSRPPLLRAAQAA